MGNYEYRMKIYRILLKKNKWRYMWESEILNAPNNNNLYSMTLPSIEVERQRRHRSLLKASSQQYAISRIVSKMTYTIYIW